MPARSILPLLAEPAMPVLETQGASAQGAADLAETARWRYHLRYLHEHMAQDEVIITASFNIPQSANGTTGAADDAPPRADYQLRAQLEYSIDGEYIQALRLTREQDEPGPARSWPSIDYRSSAGLVVELGFGAGDGAVRTYVFDTPVPAERWPRIGLTWCALDMSDAQNARASLAVVRNRGLSVQPDTGDVVVYCTATIDAADVVTPFNRWPHDIDISDPGDTVDTALDATFATLFGGRRIGQPVSMGLYYGYALQPAASPESALTTYLPVGLYTNQPTTATTAAQIAGTLAEWKAVNNPPTTGGEWLFSLVLFSQIDTRVPRPLLELGRLVYRLR